MNSIANIIEELIKSTEMNAMSSIDVVEVKNAKKSKSVFKVKQLKMTDIF